MYLKLVVISILLILSLVNIGHAQDDEWLPYAGETSVNLNRIVMKNTFFITDIENIHQGTCFLVSNRDSMNDKSGIFLVTANHVLKGMEGDYITIFMRKKEGDRYVKTTDTLQIRDNGIPSWKTFDDTLLDVAVLKVNFPDQEDSTLLWIKYLANDSVMERFDLRPGDQLNCIGYPHGIESNESGFGILKSGWLASYPVLPTNIYKSFLYDCQTFPASSGSPVIFYETGRTFLHEGDLWTITWPIAFVAGVVISLPKRETTYTLRNLKIIQTDDPFLTRVVPSSYIIDLINSYK